MSDPSHEEILEIVKRQLYYGTEIADLIQNGFTFAQLKELEGWARDHDVQKVQDDPRMARLGLLMVKFIQHSHCPICTTLSLVASFLGIQLNAIKGQHLH